MKIHSQLRLKSRQISLEHILRNESIVAWHCLVAYCRCVGDDSALPQISIALDDTLYGSHLTHQESLISVFLPNVVNFLVFQKNLINRLSPVSFSRETLFSAASTVCLFSFTLVNVRVLADSSPLLIDSARVSLFSFRNIHHRQWRSCTRPFDFIWQIQFLDKLHLPICNVSKAIFEVILLKTEPKLMKMDCLLENLMIFLLEE